MYGLIISGLTRADVETLDKYLDKRGYKSMVRKGKIEDYLQAHLCPECARAMTHKQDMITWQFSWICPGCGYEERIL